MKFPQILYVANVGAGTEDQYFETNPEAAKCISDDGPTYVATYQRIGVRILKKGVEEVRPKGKRLATKGRA